jgi:hypothetical protein
MQPLPRPLHLAELERLLKRYRVVALLGARQVGKTTLARTVAARFRGSTEYLDLEEASSLRALETPEAFLGSRTGLVVLDEVQRRPELFPVLRVLADRPTGPRFLVLGSASPELLRQTSETLAGRVAFYQLPPFNLAEVGVQRQRRLWLRGGFPPAFTAHSDAEAAEWRRNFVRTFLERDLPQLGVRIPSATLGRFWSILAHVHGQTLNWSELGRSMGVGDNTVAGGECEGSGEVCSGDEGGRKVKAREQAPHDGREDQRHRAVDRGRGDQEADCEAEADDLEGEGSCSFSVRPRGARRGLSSSRWSRCDARRGLRRARKLRRPDRMIDTDVGLGPRDRLRDTVLVHPRPGRGRR